MNFGKLSITKHALNRIIERHVLSQNIKLNKTQLKKNSKKALSIVQNDLSQAFGMCVSSDKKYKYLYTNLNNNMQCKKYVVTADRVLVTSYIVNILDELNTYNIKLITSNYLTILKGGSYNPRFIFARSKANTYLFTVDSLTKNILRVAFKGGIKC